MKVAKSCCGSCAYFEPVIENDTKSWCGLNDCQTDIHETCKDYSPYIETEIPIEQMLKSLKRAYNHYGPFCELEDVSIIESIKEAIEAAEEFINEN